MKSYLYLLISLTYALTSFSQGVGINTDGSRPAAGAILDIKSTSAGLLIPRMTEAQRDAITPDTHSMLIYQTDNDSGFYYYHEPSLSWLPLLTGGKGANSGWKLRGNTGTNPVTHFIGTTDAVDWVVKTNNTEHMRVKSDGKIGIGTNNPTNLLHVFTSTGRAANFPLLIERDIGAGTTGAPAGLGGNTVAVFSRDGNTDVHLAHGTAGSASVLYLNKTGENYFNHGYVLYNTSTSHMGIGVNGAERIRIDQNGNVGIGTTTPGPSWGGIVPKVHLKSSFPGLYFETTGATVPKTYGIWSGNYGLTFTNITDTQNHMVIKSDGNVGIGTTSPGYLLQVGNAGDGTQARANAWNNLSDKRLKKNFQEIHNPLYKVLNLKGVYFDWKSTGKKDLGFIAQDVQKVIPEIVSKSTIDGYFSMQYGNITALLVEAMKEQQQLIEELKQENSKLKTANAKKVDREEWEKLSADLDKIKVLLNQQTKK